VPEFVNGWADEASPRDPPGRGLQKKVSSLSIAILSAEEKWGRARAFVLLTERKISVYYV
jgi:hypothetical protein